MYADTANADRETSGINIIPLADVLLVLLIIFMVTAPFPTRTMSLVLPQTDSGKTVVEKTELLLRIDAAGDVYRDGVLLADLALPDVLRQVIEEGVEPVRLRIDASDQAEYEPVARVLAAAQQAGLEDIGFVRQP